MTTAAPRFMNATREARVPQVVRPLRPGQGEVNRPRHDPSSGRAPGQFAEAPGQFAEAPGRGQPAKAGSPGRLAAPAPAPVPAVDVRPGRSRPDGARTRLIGRFRSSDVLRFCALRVIDDIGPATGLDALNLLAPMARMLGEAPPLFPLLHELEDEHLLVAVRASPPRYSVTKRGRLEAARLRDAVRARLVERLGPRVRLEMLLSGT